MIAVAWLAAAVAVAAVVCLRRELGCRAELVARACHEVRGPLTAAVLGLHAAARHGEVVAARVAAVELELLRAGAALDDLGATRRNGVRSLGGLTGTRSRALDRLADDLVDVTGLLACQAEAWGVVARARGSAVRLLATAPGAVVCGDRVRLAQATGNLIANAIEHGSGPVGLCVRALGDRVRIEVVDGGRGLPGPVAVLARRARRGRGHRGRGLAIASEIVARHGGRLAAAPSADGARLTIDLPAASPAGAAARQGAAPATVPTAGAERPSPMARASAAPLAGPGRAR